MIFLGFALQLTHRHFCYSTAVLIKPLFATDKRKCFKLVLFYVALFKLNFANKIASQIQREASLNA